jgi:glycosyltransferase involved in cell wall biosynthesis
MGKNKKMSLVAKSELEDIFVSVVIVADAEVDALSTYLKDLSSLLEGHYTNYEILLVNNGVDQKEIIDASALLESLPCIRIMSLSQRTRYDTAVFAGLEAAIGDFVCTVNPTVDPIDSIEGIVKQNREYDVVQGVSDVPITGAFGNRLGRNLFYWYNRKHINIDIPINATYFASYSRRAVNALTSTHRNHRHIRHLVRLIGFRPTLFSYRPKQNPSNQRSLRTGVIEALEIATSYSTHPLRFVTWLGVFASFINILYIGYVLALNISNTRVAEGWTTTSLQLSGMFFILFIIMVILAEYVGRILVESRQEPQYYVTDESVSTISMADVSRRNIAK